MNKAKKKRILIILSAFAVLFVVGTGYAAYTANLTLKAKYNVNDNFDVKVTNITTKQLGGHAINASTPTYTGTTATFNTTLYLPGDYGEYSVTVTNAGNIDAYLKEATPVVGTNKAILFSYSGIAVNDVLPANSTKTFTVRVEYDVNVTEQPRELTGAYNLTFNFEQKA